MAKKFIKNNFQSLGKIKKIVVVSLAGTIFLTGGLATVTQATRLSTRQQVMFDDNQTLVGTLTASIYSRMNFVVEASTRFPNTAGLATTISMRNRNGYLVGFASSPLAATTIQTPSLTQFHSGNTVDTTHRAIVDVWSEFTIRLSATR